VSRGEGELLTAPKPRAVSLLSVCLTVKPVGEPDALIGHVRFDERGWETERCRMAQATAPILDSTIASFRCDAEFGRCRGIADIEQAATIKLDLLERAPIARCNGGTASRRATTGHRFLLGSWHIG